MANTATVTTTQTTPQSSTVTTAVTQTPGISIAKTVVDVGGTAGDPSATYAGEKIDYQIVVANTGNETLTNETVTDPTNGGTLASGLTLAVGASQTYTVSHTVTQAEIDAGTAVANTATVTTTQTTPQSSMVTTGVTQTPNVSIVKSVASVNGVAGDANATAAGQVIAYKVVVTNTGNETLTNVVVKDPTLGTTLGTLASLAPGASQTYTTSQAVTQAQIDAGAAVTNTATVTDTQNVTGTSTATTGVTQTPNVSIVKSVASVNGVAGDANATAAGQVIAYKVVVTNTGNETLTNVVVKDPTLGTTLGTLASLAPGASQTYTTSQAVTQAQIDAGAAVTNTATVTDTQNVTGTSTATTGVTQTPGLSIVKSVVSVIDTNHDGKTDAGDVINYDVKVTNTGNETLTHLTVTDPLTSSTLTSGTTLAVGGVVDYSTSYTILASDMTSNGNPAGSGNIVNTATAISDETPSQSSSVQTALQSPGGITVVKLPGQVVVGTCGQVTYTYNVVNTGGTPLTNVKITDNIGTAVNPDNVTPTAVLSGSFNVGDTNHNGVLDAGETWKYTNTINEAGCVTSKASSCSHTISSTDVGSGCTAWFNSNFTPTSCNDGASYTFKNVSCTISGPGCPTTKIDVPDAVVKFSKSCTQATTTYDSTQHCWVTTVPAGSNPGDVFLSGVPFQVPSGCNLNGATATWNIGESANNCGSSSLTWNAGCTGYTSFSQNGCNGQNDYNQIGVKVCDNSSAYGNGGSTDTGYGWNYGDSGAYCGGSSGGSSGGYCGSGSYGSSSWCGSSSDGSGTAENQYTSGSCDTGSSGGWSYGGGCGSYGGGSYGCGTSGSTNDGGSCGDGSTTGSVCEGQLTTSSEADTVTVSATTLGSGFSLGDAGNYGIIAFNPASFKGSSTSPINGNVGLGASCGTGTVALSSDKITGNLVSTGTKPASTGGTVTGTISGNSTTLSSDITALQTLSTTLGGETGTSVALGTAAGQTLTINATSGVLDASGNYVFTITQWANNIVIKGDGTHNVVLNIASGVTPVLDNVTLSGGLTANQVLFNDTNTGTLAGTSGTTFNGTFLAPNATFNVTGVTVNGHLFGGTSGQNFSFTSGAVLNTPANPASGTPSVTTFTATDSKEVEVLASNSAITLNGTTPTGSLSSLYGTGQIVEFSYNPSDTVSLKQIQTGLGTATGHNASPMAFIAISNNSNPFATGASIYFEGEVVTGEKIFADATLNQLTNTPIAAPNNHFSTTAGSDIFAYVFNSQSDFLNHASPIQTLAYNTSGSQAMHFGDQIGSLTVVGYVGATGGHLVS